MHFPIDIDYGFFFLSFFKSSALKRHFILANESHVSLHGVNARPRVCFGAYVWVCFFVYQFLFQVRMSSQCRGKHIEGRCGKGSCSALPSTKESLCHRESVPSSAQFVTTRRNVLFFFKTVT